MNPNEGCRLTHDEITGEYTFKWWGRAGHTYFIQCSDDLIHWSYVPVIESGAAAVTEYGFSSTAGRFFLRLRHTDAATGGNPDTADFDGDGAGNLAELEAGLDPFHRIDSDADGLSDDREVLLGLDPHDADTDDDGFGDGVEVELGSSPVSPALTPLAAIAAKLAQAETLLDEFSQMQIRHGMLAAMNAKWHQIDDLLQTAGTYLNGIDPLSPGAAGQAKAAYEQAREALGKEPSSVMEVISWFKKGYEGHWNSAGTPDVYELYNTDDMGERDLLAGELTQAMMAAFSYGTDPQPLEMEDLTVSDGRAPSLTMLSVSSHKEVQDFLGANWRRLEITHSVAGSHPQPQSFTWVVKVAVYDSTPGPTHIYYGTLSIDYNRPANNNVVLSTVDPIIADCIQIEEGLTKDIVRLEPPLIRHKHIHVDLLPVEIVGPGKEAVSELKVGDMEESLNAESSSGDARLKIDDDPDRFYVRIADLSDAQSVSVKLETVENPDSRYDDDATEIELTEVSGGFETKSLLLVSGDVDDGYEGEYDIGADDPLGLPSNDRTHKVQLGGKVKISAIIIDGHEWTADLRVPVPVKKTVTINAVIMTDSGVSSVTDEVRWANERFASTGLKIELGTTAVENPPAPLPGKPDVGSQVVDSDVADWGRYISHYGTAPNITDIHVFFVKQCVKSNNSPLQGFAICESLWGNTTNTRTAGQTGDANNLFVSGSHTAWRTLAHELTHVLTDAGHYGEAGEESNTTNVYDYDHDAPDHKRKHNLMGIRPTPGLNSADQIWQGKRLYDRQRQKIWTHRTIK